MVTRVRGRDAHATAIAELGTALAIADRLATGRLEYHGLRGSIDVRAARGTTKRSSHHDPGNANSFTERGREVSARDKPDPEALALYRETLARHQANADAGVSPGRDPSHASWRLQANKLGASIVELEKSIR